MSHGTAQTSTQDFVQGQVEGYRPRGLDNCRVSLGSLKVTQILLPLAKVPGDFVLPRMPHWVTGPGELSYPRHLYLEF